MIVRIRAKKSKFPNEKKFDLPTLFLDMLD